MHLVLDSFYIILCNFPSKIWGKPAQLGPNRILFSIIMKCALDFLPGQGELTETAVALLFETTSQHLWNDSVQDSWHQATEDSDLWRAELCKRPSWHRQEALGKPSGLQIWENELSPVRCRWLELTGQRAWKERAAKKVPLEDSSRALISRGLGGNQSWAHNPPRGLRGPPPGFTQGEDWHLFPLHTHQELRRVLRVGLSHQFVGSN